MMLVLAQDGGGGAGSLVGSLLPLLLIGAFVYFVMIRPQRKRQQEFKAMQRDLTVGDDIVTVGGMHGRVDALGDDTVDLEVTDDIVLRFKRSAIGEIVRDEPAEEPDTADEAAE